MSKSPFAVKDKLHGRLLGTRHRLSNLPLAKAQITPLFARLSRAEVVNVISTALV